MDVKRNKRFSGQNDTLRLVSGGMLILGLLWFWLGWSAASYYGPCVMVPVGFVLFLIASGRHVSESEIRTTIQRHLSDLDADITQNDEYSRRILATPGPYRGESFAFDESVNMVRRGKDAKLLSDTYCATAVFVTRDELILRGRRISLIGDETKDVQLMVPRAEVGLLEICSFESPVVLSNQRNAQATARGAILCLYKINGEMLYNAPVPNDMNAEALCSAIHRWKNR